MRFIEEFEVHSKLNPKLWNSDNTLKQDVHDRLFEIVDQFLECCEFPLNVVDIHLVGSNASYNYTNYSDLDVHLVSNFELIDAPKELIQTAYNAIKAKFNQDYDISIHGIDVELYVEDIRSTAITNGIYSLLTGSWIRFPKKLSAVPQIDITDMIDVWSQKFQSAINSNSSEQITQVIDNLYLMRKNSLDTDGEFGAGNLLFKEIRNRGLLDSAKDAYKKFRSKELTLEHFLNEDSRVKLLSKSKQSKKGFQRFKQRVKSRVANTVKQYNSIDMNKLFKDDILTVDVQVKGETDNYIVKISFGGFLELLHDQLKRDPVLNLKSITRALVNGFNRDDVYIHCSCPDAQYRFAYWQTRNKVNSGEAENRPSNITNPHDDLGASCKHVLLVLSNTSWLLKVASTIFNYVNYMEKHYQKLYADVIYPAIYQKSYEEPVQLDIFDDTLDTSSDTLDASNKYARTKNQFQKGNEFRYKEQPDKNQLSIDDVGENPTDSNENN